MPGEYLDFKCPCGFNAPKVQVGARQTGHYLVVLCLECHRMLSIWEKERPGGQGSKIPTCKRCGNPLMPITEPGAWSPSELYKKFPDTDPWIVGEESWFDRFGEEPTEEEMALFKEIRVLCPRCRNYSVEYETVAYWD